MAVIIKRVVLWLGIAFVAYTIIASPAKAAEMVQTAFGGISTAGESVGNFFDALVS